MTDVKHPFGLIGRFTNAFGDAMMSAVEEFAAEMSEAAKSLPEREYWRGYQDGRADAEESSTTRFE